MLTAIFDIILLLSIFFYLSLFVTDYSFILYENRISNIAMPTTGFIFLIFLRWLIDKKGFFRCKFTRITYGFSAINEKTFLLLAVSIIAILFSTLSLARHYSLASCASDLGIFDQAVWNSTKGRILFSSLKNNMNLLGDHFEPILLFIIPLYKLWPNPCVLLILQAILLASAVIPLYLIAKTRIKEKLIVYAVIVAYILNRPIRGIALSDFHPECFMVPILFWAYYFLIQRKNALFFVLLSLLVLCKEDVTFLIAGIGIFCAISLRRIKLGVSLLISGLLLWFLETKIIIPLFNPSGTYAYMNRFPLGLTYMDNINSILTNPSNFIQLMFCGPKINYILKIFGPLLFLSLLSPKHYVLWLIPLLKNLFVNPNFSGFYNISSHYTASLIPFVFISAIYGAGLLEERAKKKVALLSIAALVIFSSLIFYGKTDGHQLSRFLCEIKNKRTLERVGFLKKIPRDASVCANYNLVPHLSRREFIFEWNPRSPSSFITEYIIVDMNLLEYLSDNDRASIKEYFKQITEKGYKIFFLNKDGTFLIFHNSSIDKDLSQKLI